MPIKIEIAARPSEADRKAIRGALVSYNLNNGGPPGFKLFSIKLRDTRKGATVGGLWGQLYYDWLFVELLYVPEEARGRDIGSRLIAEAEAFARRNGCVGVWLDTFSFQAPDFYRKLGYKAFGVLRNYPKGSKRVFFRKSLDGTPPRTRLPKGSEPRRRRRLP